MTLKANIQPRAKLGQGMNIQTVVLPFAGHGLLVGLVDGAVCFAGFTDDHSTIFRYYPQSQLCEYKGNYNLLGDELGQIWGQDNLRALDTYVEGTDFQVQVWRELLNIKAGHPINYRDIAQKLGRPKSMRAVGNAVGANPVSVFIPCHRVVHAGGQKMGYAWGADIKCDLLKAEEEFTHPA